MIFYYILLKVNSTKILVRLRISIYLSLKLFLVILNHYLFDQVRNKDQTLRHIFHIVSRSYHT